MPGGSETYIPQVLMTPEEAVAGSAPTATSGIGSMFSAAAPALGPVALGVAIASAIPSIVKMFGGIRPATPGTASQAEILQGEIKNLEAQRQKGGSIPSSLIAGGSHFRERQMRNQALAKSDAILLAEIESKKQQLAQLTQSQIQSIAQPVPSGFTGSGVGATLAGQGASPNQVVGQATFNAPTSATQTPATVAATSQLASQPTQQNFLQQLMSMFGGGAPFQPVVQPGTQGSQAIVPQNQQNPFIQSLQGLGQNFAQGLGQIPVVGGALQGGAEAIGGGINSIGSFLGNLFGGQQTGNQLPGGQPPGGVMTGFNAGDRTQSNQNNNWMSQLQSMFNPNNIAGLGALGLGALDDKRIQIPDFESNPRIQALSNWTNTANHPLDPNVDASIQRSLDIQNEQRLRNLRDVYKNARPGGDYLNDSAYQRDLANLNRSMALNAADAKAQPQLQSNAQNIGIMSDLAQGSVGQNWAQAAFDTQRNTGRQKMFGDIASSFFGRGTPAPR